MIDNHFHPRDWGVLPYIDFLGINVPTYSLFVFLGLLAGIIIYYLEARKQKQANENSFYLAFGAIFGGVLGAKIPIWIVYYREIIASLPDMTLLLSGRTILGGLIGGFIGVLITKKILGIKEKRGNLFAPGIALGVAIGRIGCFLRGCCYGKETILPWGVDFGDGVLRHPTQIYESIFMIFMFVLLQKKKKNARPGELFNFLMIYYFTFRFFIEFIRVEKVIFLGLTAFQYVCILALIYLNKERLHFLWKKISKN